MFFFALITGFFLVIFSLIVAGNIIQMMSVNADTGEISYPEPTTALLVVGIVLLSNTLLLVSVASLVCAAIKKFRGSRQASTINTASTDAATGASAGAGAGAGSSCESRPCVFASFVGRLRQLIPARPTNISTDQAAERGLYSPLVGADTQTEMISFDQQRSSSAFTIQQQYPQMPVATAPVFAAVTGHAAAIAAPGQVVYVPVSAQAMSNINML